MDQIAAKAFERETQLSSLQLQMDDNSLVGSCDVGYSCAYSSTISWLTPTLPLMTENNPRVVFERLFGASDSTDPKVRAARLQSGPEHARFGDGSREAAAAAARGRRTTRRVNDYLTSLRDVERRIQKTEEQSAKEVPDVARPAGIPDSFDEHAQLLYDLQLLAYQSDITRVITFMYGREQSPRPYPQIGVPEPHHPLTHHQNDPEKMAKCAKIQQYHLKLFADYLEKLRNTPDGDGSLLDHVMILYGAGISNSDRHTHGPLPTLRRRRRRGHAQGRAPSRLSGTHAADEPSAHDAESARRAGGEAGRQHRAIQGALRPGRVGVVIIHLHARAGRGCVVGRWHRDRCARTIVPQWKAADATRAPLSHRHEFSPKQQTPPHFKAYATTASGERTLLGVAFWTTELDPLERGYDGPIKILVGMNMNGVLTGVVVAEHHEPYGYF